MNQTDAKTHEQWKQYLARGGVLNQSSFVRFQERYPQILSSDEEHESAQDAWEDGLDSGLTNITAQYCAAFGTLLEENLDLRDTSMSPIYWHSNEWRVRESLLLINDQEASKLRETSY